MKKDADDVFLNDGEGYMVEWMPYIQHLEGSIETKQVIPLPYSSLKILILLISDNNLCQSQGCHSSQCKQEKSGCNRCWCMCMCLPWLLCASLCGRLPKRRTVWLFDSIQTHA